LADAQIDVKGHRRLRPAQQKDPDMYVHVVDELSDGIVVTGSYWIKETEEIARLLRILIEGKLCSRAIPKKQNFKIVNYLHLNRLSEVNFIYFLSKS